MQISPCGSLAQRMARAIAAKLGTALEQHFSTRAASDWFQALDVAGVPVEVVDEDFCRTIFDDPHARERQLISETWAGAVGRFEDPGLLATLRDTPGVVQRGPSMCGERLPVMKWTRSAL